VARTHKRASCALSLFTSLVRIIQGGGGILHTTYHTTHTTIAERRAEESHWRQMRQRVARRPEEASGRRKRPLPVSRFFFFLSHVMHTHKRAERRARNIAGAEAPAVARRPEVASREKNLAAAGIRRFFFVFGRKTCEVCGQFGHTRELCSVCLLLRFVSFCFWCILFNIRLIPRKLRGSSP